MGLDWTISSVLKISKISILIIFCLMSKLIGWKPSKTRICSIQFNWKLIAIQLQTQPPVDRSLLNVKVFISDFRENNRNSNKNEHWSCKTHLWLFWFSERLSGSSKSGASLGQKFWLGHRTGFLMLYRRCNIRGFYWLPRFNVHSSDGFYRGDNLNSTNFCSLIWFIKIYFIRAI